MVVEVVAGVGEVEGAAAPEGEEGSAAEGA